MRFYRLYDSLYEFLEIERLNGRLEVVLFFKLVWKIVFYGFYCFICIYVDENVFFWEMNLLEIWLFD